MRVFITGGAGYIGSHTIVEALRAGFDVLAVDNFANSDPSTFDAIRRITNREIGWAEGDIRDTDRMARLMTAFRPDAVVHFAGLKAVGESVSRPIDYFDVNVGGTLSLLKAMDATGTSRLVFSSSATVYGAPQYLPIDENHPLSATNPYGRSKLHVEEMLRDQAVARPDWSFALLRYFNPVGAHDSGLIGERPRGAPNNLMPYVAQVAAGERETLSIFGDDYDTPDGTGVRDYIHVLDLAEAHIAALRWSAAACGARAFNIGAGRGMSVLEMVRLFERASGKTVPIKVGPRRPGDVASCLADPSRAARELDWSARRGVDEMCRSGWAWQQAQALQELSL